MSSNYRLSIRTVFVWSVAALLVLCLPTLASARRRAKHSKSVERVQQTLRDKGYDPGPVDGVIGPQTRQAIGQYQKAENLPVTQRLDAKTSAGLGVSEPRESAKAGSAGCTFKTAGHDFAKGGENFGHEIAKGKPIEAGKDLGKGVGGGGEKTGQGVAKAVTP